MRLKVAEFGDNPNTEAKVAEKIENKMSMREIICNPRRKSPVVYIFNNRIDCPNKRFAEDVDERRFNGTSEEVKDPHSDNQLRDILVIFVHEQ